MNGQQSLTRQKPEIYASKMKLQHYPKSIDSYYEYNKSDKKYHIYTDELKYGNHLEIVYSNQDSCFVIKDFFALKEKWYKKYGKSKKDVDNVIEKYLET